MRGVIVGDVREVDAERRRRDHRAGDRPRLPRPDPRRRHRAAAAQDPVRRAVRRPRAARRTPAASGWPTATSSGRTAARTPSSCSGSSTTLLPLLQAVAARRTSRYTLGAVADALRGRGNALGENLAATGEYFGADQHRAAASCRPTSPSWPTSPTPTTRAADDLLGVLDNLSVTNTTAGRPGGAAAPHVHRRRQLVERDGGLPGDQRAQPHLAGRRPRGRCSGVFAKYSPDTRACSTAWPGSTR